MKNKKHKKECVKRTRLLDDYRFPKIKIKRRRRVTHMIYRNVPVDLKAQFKSWCAERGYTMTGRMRDLMRATVKGELDEV